MKKCVILFFLIVLNFPVLAQIPNGYYDSASGKTGDTLRAALRNIIANGHTKLPYTSGSFDVWDAYAVTDVRPFPDTVTIWDMYSDIPNGTNYTFTIYTNQCGSSGAEGGCYAREHLVPNSWWGGIDNSSNPQYTDLHHLFPADQYVNNKKSAHPLGEVANPTWTSSNGSKLGTCSVQGYSGTVFEPINEYKGDFARAYLYIATRYMNEISNWIANYPNTEAQHVINTSNNFKPWIIDMLISWHTNDPVSQKEINRNNAVYYQTPQHNRNPFVDHPEYVCKIWASANCTSPPLIANITNFPQLPYPSDTVIINANITDNDSVANAITVWSTDGQNFNDTLIMNNGIPPEYTTINTIPVQAGGTTVYYKIIATDNENHTTVSDTYSYTVLKNEPTNHPNSFSCTTITDSTITLIWVDALGGVTPDGYLVKASPVSYTSITDPTDGLVQPNSTFIRNIPQGTQSATFNGLAQTTTYYFKIFPYTNSSSNINYKTDQTITATNCATTAKVGCAESLIISEYIEGSGSNKYIELYNNTGAAVNLSNYRLQLFNNGGASPSNSVTLSGTLNNQQTIVYKNSSSTLYNGATTNNSSVNFNGNDAIALFKISDSSFVDIVGRIGENPGTAWTSGSHSTLDKTLVRKSTVTSGISVNPTSGFPTLETEWLVYSIDDTTHLGSHTMDCESCASPIVASSGIFATATSDTSITVNWTKGDGTKRIVVAKQESSVVGIPGQNATYIADSVFANGDTLETGEYLVYNDTGSFVNINGLQTGTTYYFTIFEYSCNTGDEKYLTPGISTTQTTYSISIETTDDNSYCVTTNTGANTSILITSTGTFNNNTYTIQLSDSSGSFSNPVTVGTVQSDSNNVIIPYTIPANTLTGFGYRIRAISSNPIIISNSSNPFDVILTPPCIAPDSIISNRNNLCISDTGNITLSAIGGSGSQLSWFTSGCNGILVGTGDTVKIPAPDTTTTYYARWENACEISACVAQTVIVIPNVTSSISIIANKSDTICFGENIIFTAMPVNGGDSPHYQWKKNGINIQGATDSIYTTTTLISNDTITCELISNATCNTNSHAASNTISLIVNSPIAPAGDTTQIFCNYAYITDIAISGTNIKWYSSDSGTSVLNDSLLVTDGSSYFATQSINSCESSNRLKVSTVIHTPPTPTGDTIQTFCNNAKISNLVVAGSNITWYSSDSAQTPLSDSSAIINGNNYFATQTINNCQSSNRFKVNVVINTTPTPTGDTIQTFCNNAKISDLVVIGSNTSWYSSDSTQTPLGDSSAIINGNNYFATQTINNCQSNNRFKVNVVINTTPAPTGDTIQTFCGSAIINNMAINGSDIVWYISDTGSILATDSASLSNETYYFATQTINNCESIDRFKVQAIINPLPQVSLQPITPVCYTTAGYALTGGSPVNGTYSGNNVINDTLYATAPNTTETITYTITDSNNCTNSTSAFIDIEICTTTETANSTQSDIQLFPNPNNGIFNIALKNKNTDQLHIKLYDIHGQIIFNKQEYNIPANSTKQIQLNDLQKGIYLLELKTEYGIQTHKVVIQ